MPKQKLPPNAPCPCESGRPYGRCCYDKGFEYLVDEDGIVFKAVPVPDELAEALEEQKQRFIDSSPSAVRGAGQRSGNTVYNDRSGGARCGM